MDSFLFVQVHFTGAFFSVYMCMCDVFFFFFIGLVVHKFGYAESFE